MKLKSILLLAVSMSMLACQKPSSEQSQMVSFTVSMSALVGSKLPAPQKAEELAKAAELLLTADGMFEAYSMANAALKIDPNNLRAGFIKALLAPMMAFKGLYGRGKKFAEKHPKTFNESGTLEEWEAKTNPISVRFLEDVPKGVGELNRESDLQDVVDQFLDAIDQLRLFAHNHKNSELTLKENSILFPDLSLRYAQACEITTVTDGEYELKCPDSRIRHEVSFNRADFEGVEMMAMTTNLFLRFYNAYDLNGAYDISEKNFDLPKDTQQSLFYQQILQNPEFGKLRKNNQLKEMKGQATGIIASFDWIAANQGTLCKNPGPSPMDGDPHNRVGMAFNKGLCFPMIYKQALLNPFIEVINGKTVYSEKTAADGTPVKVQVNYFALLDHPVSDLHDLGPFKFDACGGLLSADPNFGGAFPNRDGNQLWPLAAAKCEQP